jgi:hypothetical protein
MIRGRLRRAGKWKNARREINRIAVFYRKQLLHKNCFVASETVKVAS